MIDELMERQTNRRQLVERIAARWLAMKRQVDGGRPVDEKKVMAIMRVNPHLHDRTLRDAELFLKAYEDVSREMAGGGEPRA